MRTIKGLAPTASAGTRRHEAWGAAAGASAVLPVTLAPFGSPNRPWLKSTLPPNWGGPPPPLLQPKCCSGDTGLDLGPSPPSQLVGPRASSLASLHFQNVGLSVANPCLTHVAAVSIYLHELSRRPFMSTYCVLGTSPPRAFKAHHACKRPHFPVAPFHRQQH